MTPCEIIARYRKHSNNLGLESQENIRDDIQANNFLWWITP